jgi:hypothetical protein
MRTALALAAVLVVLSPLSVPARILTVDCNGGADYTDLREGMMYASMGDTLMVAPCVYPILPASPPSSGWPLELPFPAVLTMIGTDGAAATVLEGDGSTSVFRITGGSEGSVFRIQGFTFRNLSMPLEREFGVTISLYFTDNVVEDCGAGLDASSIGPRGGASVIARNIIRNNGGPWGLSVYHNSGLIEGNEICYNRDGIDGGCCEEPTIRGNHIHHNSAIGISPAFVLRADYNIIEDNGELGLYLPAGQVVMRHNIIRRNPIGALGYNLLVYSTFSCNEIYDNTLYNIRSDCDSGPPWTFDATMNWWGTTDPDEIAASIYDCHDDPAIRCCVEFDPWCMEPGCDTTPVRASSWSAIKALFAR